MKKYLASLAVVFAIIAFAFTQPPTYVYFTYQGLVTDESQVQTETLWTEDTGGDLGCSGSVAACQVKVDASLVTSGSNRNLDANTGVDIDGVSTSGGKFKAEILTGTAIAINNFQ